MKHQAQRHQEIFLHNLDDYIEAHLSDSKLHIEHLLRFTGMSRTKLHCKLKQAAGMSATEYVRQRRLQKASHLLQDNPNWCVLAVALEVGFENLGYFTRRFKERYGCSPGAWREMALQEEG
ncbi:MAG: helix-turn-helix transcriptional regulator [Saprospiraceae bacterium]